MDTPCTDSAVELLTPKLKQYIADRIMRRFSEHRKQLDGIVLLDSSLFQNLMNDAFNDAVHEGLVEDSMKLPLGLLLAQDEAFFADIRWNLPLPDRCANAG